MSTIIAAADGSALGNPGPAGWAWYIDESNWSSGGWEHGTNNMGELKAVIELFQATAPAAERKLVVYCDSQYVINSLTQWMPGWKKRGWKKADGKPVLNRELLQQLDAATAGRDYELVWVKGHAGHTLNEAADTRANTAAQAYKAGTRPDAGPGFVGAGGAGTGSAGANGTAFAESSADAHLPVEEFTQAQAEQARAGFDALKLNGVLKPASTMASPNPQQVAARKAQLEQAARRAEETASAAEAAVVTETAAGAEPGQIRPVESHPVAADPDEALAAEEELEATGAMMSESEIAELLHEQLLWVTADGRLVPRALTIEYRTRAFTQRGKPLRRTASQVDAHNVLIVAVVATARGRVNRSSLWHYDQNACSWRLRFRQESAIAAA